jgi:hypothetical protein
MTYLAHAAAVPALAVLLAGGSCGHQPATHSRTFPPGPRGSVVGFAFTSNSPDRPCPRTATRVNGDCILRFALRIADVRGGTVEVPVSYRVYKACDHDDIFPACARKA